MTWQIIEVEPQYGICDQCKSHECGIVDGKHVWIRTGIRDHNDDHIVIGHGCVKSWAENLGITKEVVTRDVVRPPTDTEILEVVHSALNRIKEADEAKQKRKTKAVDA